VAVVGLAWWFVTADPKPIDFLSFWAAGQLGGDAYNAAALKAVEGTIVQFTGQLPFPYPPPFLFLVTPFAMLPFSTALAAWLVLTGGLFLAVLRRFDFPAAVAAGLIGQASFVVTACFAGGLKLLDRRPLLAGALLGCLVIKPQLAALMPLALAAGGYWRSFVAAAASSLLLCVAALIVFGADAYAGFFVMLGRYSEFIDLGMWPWSKMASVYALSRDVGFPAAVAWGAHLAIASVACAIVWKTWRIDHEAKIPMLAGASVLISPYLFTYDALLLIIPFAWLLKRSPAVAWGIWFLCLLPVLAFFNLYGGPNTVPCAAILCLAALSSQSWRRTLAHEGMAPGPDSNRRPSD